MKKRRPGSKPTQSWHLEFAEVSTFAGDQRHPRIARSKLVYGNAVDDLRVPEERYGANGAKEREQGLVDRGRQKRGRSLVPALIDAAVITYSEVLRSLHHITSDVQIVVARATCGCGPAADV